MGALTPTSGGCSRRDPVIARWVLNASSVLAWLQNEQGADEMDPLLGEAAISTVNWSEVLQKVIQRGRDAPEAGALLEALGVEVIPLTAEEAMFAAKLWLQTPSLSLGDRCCLSLSRRLEAPAVTADQQWRTLSVDVAIRPIR